MSEEQVAAGGAEEAVAAIEDTAWPQPDAEPNPNPLERFPAKQTARKMVFDFSSLEAGVSYAFRVKVESQASPSEKVATAAGATDTAAVESVYSDVMVCTAPTEFKGIKLAIAGGSRVVPVSAPRPSHPSHPSHLPVDSPAPICGITRQRVSPIYRPSRISQTPPS